MPRRSRQHDSAAGLTLIEVLVVTTLLSALTVAVAPSGSAWMLNAQVRDGRNQLETSWRMARILALANGQPVVWEFQSQSGQIRILQGRNTPSPEVLWSTRLGAAHAKVTSPSAEQASDVCRVVVGPDGLTNALGLDLLLDGQMQHIELSGVWNEEIAPAVPETTLAEGG